MPPAAGIITTWRYAGLFGDNAGSLVTMVSYVIGIAKLCDSKQTSRLTPTRHSHMFFTDTLRTLQLSVITLRLCSYSPSLSDLYNYSLSFSDHGSISNSTAIRHRSQISTTIRCLSQIMGQYRTLQLSVIPLKVPQPAVVTSDPSRFPRPSASARSSPEPAG